MATGQKTATKEKKTMDKPEEQRAEKLKALDATEIMLQFQEQDRELHTGLRLTTLEDQEFIACTDCGDMWAVVRHPDDPLIASFHQMDAGDGSCLRNAVEKSLKRTCPKCGSDNSCWIPGIDVSDKISHISESPDRTEYEPIFTLACMDCFMAIEKVSGHAVASYLDRRQVRHLSTD